MFCGVRSNEVGARTGSCEETVKDVFWKLRLMEWELGQGGMMK